jgi:hypothetical protein
MCMGSSQPNGQGCQVQPPLFPFHFCHVYFLFCFPLFSSKFDLLPYPCLRPRFHSTLDAVVFLFLSFPAVESLVNGDFGRDSILDPSLPTCLVGLCQDGAPSGRINKVHQTAATAAVRTNKNVFVKQMFNIPARSGLSRVFPQFATCSFPPALFSSIPSSCPERLLFPFPHAILLRSFCLLPSGVSAICSYPRQSSSFERKTPSINLEINYTW